MLYCLKDEYIHMYTICVQGGMCGAYEPTTHFFLIFLFVGLQILSEVCLGGSSDSPWRTHHVQKTAMCPTLPELGSIKKM